MTVYCSPHDRCRLCYTLILRDRQCYQKFYHLFKPIQRTKLPRKHIFSPNTIKFSQRTVCFQQLISRYLHTNLPNEDQSFSNYICYNCSKILLEIEQCAKYLTKTINQLKMKLNKSNRLLTSSLTVKFQKKQTLSKIEQLPLMNSDEDEEFEDDIDEDDVDDDEEEEENEKFDEDKLISNNGACQNGGDDDDEDDDDDDEDGLIKPSIDRTHPARNLLDGTDPQALQMYMAQFIRNFSGISPATNAMLNTYADMQRNFLKMCNNPLTVNQLTPQISPISLTTVHPKQNSSSSSSNNNNNNNHNNNASGRKRKSPPEKRVINNNNGNNLSNLEQDVSPNDDHPLELTVKDPQRSTRMINSKYENGSSSFDEDHRESITSNESSRSVRSSLTGQSMIHHPSSTATAAAAITTDLLSPNHVDDNTKQRKLDPRPCIECGKILFSDKTHLFHCQTHAKNEKQCWICGVHDDDIKKHILNEHGNQKITNTGFKCQHCEKVFPVFADLENHTKEHSKKKPFECSICHKRFGQQGNLSCHLRIHSGVKPFTCTSCGKAFRHSNSLRRHARTVHSAARGVMNSTSTLLSSNPPSLLSSNDLRTESFDDQLQSGLMIPSDDGSSSTGGIPPSPTMSNTQVDSD